MARRSSTEAYEVKGADLMDDTEVRCALQSIFFAKVGCGAERLCLLSMTLDLRRQNGAVEYPERSEIVIVDLPNWMQLRSVEGMIRISRKCIHCIAGLSSLPPPDLQLQGECCRPS